MRVITCCFISDGSHVSTHSKPVAYLHHRNGNAMHCAPCILCSVQCGSTTLQGTHVAQYCQHTSVQSPQRQNAVCMASCSRRQTYSKHRTSTRPPNDAEQDEKTGPMPNEPQLSFDAVLLHKNVAKRHSRAEPQAGAHAARRCTQQGGPRGRRSGLITMRNLAVSCVDP